MIPIGKIRVVVNKPKKMILADRDLKDILDDLNSVKTITIQQVIRIQMAIRKVNRFSVSLLEAGHCRGISLSSGQ